MPILTPLQVYYAFTSNAVVFVFPGTWEIDSITESMFHSVNNGDDEQGDHVDHVAHDEYAPATTSIYLVMGAPLNEGTLTWYIESAEALTTTPPYPLVAPFNGTGTTANFIVATPVDENAAGMRMRLSAGTIITGNPTLAKIRIFDAASNPKPITSAVKISDSTIAIGFATNWVGGDGTYNVDADAIPLTLPIALTPLTGNVIAPL